MRNDNAVMANIVPFNIGESKKNKLINVSIDGNTDGKNYVVSKRKKSFFFYI